MFAKRLLTSRVWSISPDDSWITITAGWAPPPAGRAREALPFSPPAPATVSSSATMRPGSVTAPGTPSGLGLTSTLAIVHLALGRSVTGVYKYGHGASTRGPSP